MIVPAGIQRVALPVQSSGAPATMVPQQPRVPETTTAAPNSLAAAQGILNAIIQAETNLSTLVSFANKAEENLSSQIQKTEASSSTAAPKYPGWIDYGPVMTSNDRMVAVFKGNEAMESRS